MCRWRAFVGTVGLIVLRWAELGMAEVALALILTGPGVLVWLPGRLAGYGWFWLHIFFISSTWAR